MSDNAYPSRMSDADAVLWLLEDDPMMRSNVVSVTVFDRMPDRQRFMYAIERMMRIVPRFRQRVVTDPLGLAPPHWESDPHFDLGYHLRFASVGGDGDIDDVLELAAPIGMQVFDKARPLWEFTLVDGLAGERAALIAKIHHAITDGVGGVDMSMSLYDFERDAEPKPMPPVPDEAHGGRDGVLDGAREELSRGVAAIPSVAAAGLSALTRLARQPVDTARTLVAIARSAKRTIGPTGAALSDVMTARSLSVRYAAMTLPLALFKDTAKAAGGTVNDVFVTVIANGLAAYHAKHGSSVPAVRMSMMVNLRCEDSGPLGNEFTAVRVSIPMGRADAAQSFAEVQRAVQEALREPSLPLNQSLMSVARRLPSAVILPVMADMQRGVDVISSNIPGSPVPIFLAGARIERILPFGPRSGSAINITLMSHIDDVSIGIAVDPAAVPDHDVLMDCLHSAMDDIRMLGDGFTK